LSRAAESSGRQRGFTLLEAVVAFAIASLALVALFRATSDGLGGAEAAGNSIEATRRAQSILAAVGVTEKLQPGEQSGALENGFDWRVVVTLQDERPAPAPAGLQAVPSNVDLYRVEATVGWRHGGTHRSVTLTGYRLLTQSAQAADAGSLLRSRERAG
jgi:general secretion pathway protein I